MMAVFTYASLLDTDGLIVSVLYGAGLFTIGAIGGAIWILGSERKAWAAGENRAENRVDASAIRRNSD
jgi:hypothetical protein